MSLFSRVALALALAATGAAAHATETVKISDYQPSIHGYQGNITANGKSFTALGERLEISAVDTATSKILSFYSYCIEPTVSGPTGYFDIVAGSSRFTPVKLQQLANLLKNGNDAINAAGGDIAQRIASTAMAMAVWEITSEKGALAADYNLRTNLFRMGSGDHFDQVYSAATNYINNVMTGKWTGGDVGSVSVLASRADLNHYDRQDQIAYIPRTPPLTPPTSVPEPESWATMLIGMGMLGALVRRRRQRTAA